MGLSTAFGMTEARIGMLVVGNTLPFAASRRAPAVDAVRRDRVRKLGRAVGCYRVAPTVPRGHRQREGAGVRPDHRRVNAKARAAPPSYAAAPSQRQLARLSSAGFFPC